MALQNADYMAFLNEDSEIPTDISFKVYQSSSKNVKQDYENDAETRSKIFRAHKYFLAVASPVFRRQYFGSFPEQADPIIIEQTTIEAFGIMIDFIYKKNEHFTFTCENFSIVFEVRNLAEKYQISSLVSKAEEEISNRHLSPANLIEAAESANNYQHFPKISLELTLRCKKYFSKHYQTMDELRSLLNTYEDSNINTDILLMLIKSGLEKCLACKRLRTECLDGMTVTKKNVMVGVNVVLKSPSLKRSNDAEGVGVIIRKDEIRENQWYVRWENDNENGGWSIVEGKYFLFKCH